MENQDAFMAMTGACFLALTFLRAVLHKVGSYAEFVGNVRDYRVLPETLAPVAASTVMALEGLAVAGLVLPQTRAPAAVLAAGLLAVYAIAIAWNLARGRNTIDCGCGGGGQHISPLHILRNGVLALFAVPVVVYSGAVLPVSTPFFLAAGCVLVLWLTFLVFDQLLGNHIHASVSTYSKL